MEDARELEARQSTTEAAVITPPSRIENASFVEPDFATDSDGDEGYFDEGEDEDFAPGIKT